MMKNLSTSAYGGNTLTAQAHTVANGVAFDTQGYHWADVVITSSATGGAQSYTVIIQEADDAAFTSGVATVAGATHDVAINTPKAIRVGGLNLHARKRYIRARVSAAAGGPFFSVAFLFQGIDTSKSSAKALSGVQNPSTADAQRVYHDYDVAV